MDGNDELLFYIGRGIGQFIVLATIVYYVKKGAARCCCRRGQPVEAGPEVREVTVEGQSVPVSVNHLIHKKDVATTFMLCAYGGIFGAHHFYLDRVTHGVICIWTANFFFFGYFVDLILVPYYVRMHNQKAVDAKVYGATPPQKFSCCACLSWRVSLVYLALIVFFVVALIKLPRGLHDARIIDIDAAIAGTTQNPYDIVGVPRGSPEDVVAQAYIKQVHALEFSGKRCDAKCELKIEQLEKAVEFIDGGWRLSHGVKDDVSAWDDWADFIALEWEVVFAHIQVALDDPDTFQGKPPTQQPRSRGTGKSKSAKGPPPAMGKASSKAGAKGRSRPSPDDRRRRSGKSSASATADL